MHTASIHFTQPVEGIEVQHFASLDGEHYLPVDRLPMPGEEAELAALFEGDGRTRPMRWLRRAISQSADQFGDTVEYGEI